MLWDLWQDKNGESKNHYSPFMMTLNQLKLHNLEIIYINSKSRAKDMVYLLREIEIILTRVNRLFILPHFLVVLPRLL